MQGASKNLARASSRSASSTVCWPVLGAACMRTAASVPRQHHAVHHASVRCRRPAPIAPPPFHNSRPHLDRHYSLMSPAQCARRTGARTANPLGEGVHGACLPNDRVARDESAEVCLSTRMFNSPVQLRCRQWIAWHAWHGCASGNTTPAPNVSEAEGLPQGRCTIQLSSLSNRPRAGGGCETDPTLPPGCCRRPPRAAAPAQSARLIRRHDRRS